VAGTSPTGRPGGDGELVFDIGHRDCNRAALG
jgi:hypothetical protein